MEPTRTLKDVNTDYSALCLQLGDLEYKYKMKREAILNQMRGLDVEAEAIKEADKLNVG